MESVRTSLAPELEKECQCQFSADYLKLGELQCISAHTDWLILWGRIIGTNHTNSTGIRNKLQIWSQQESMVVVEGVHLKTLKFCSVSLKKGEPPHCSTPSNSTLDKDEEAASLPSNTVEEDEKDTSLPSTVIYAAVAGGVILLILVTITLICVGTVLIFRKRNVSNRQRSGLDGLKKSSENVSTKDIKDVHTYETVFGAESPYSDIPSQTSCPAIQSSESPPPPLPPSTRRPPASATRTKPPPPSQPAPPTKPSHQQSQPPPPATNLPECNNKDSKTQFLAGYNRSQTSQQFPEYATLYAVPLNTDSDYI